MRLVEVEWEDSAFAMNPGWHDKDETVSPSICRSVGWVHEKTKAKLVLVNSVDGDGRIAGLQVIPASAIRKTRRLRR